MATEWRDVSIGDIALHIAMGPFGSNIKAENFVSSGVPVIRGTNLTQGRFRADDFVFLTPEKADELANSVARPGDLVFTHRGTLGQVGVIPDAPYERYVVSQSQMKLTCDDRSVDPMFLYYYFLSPMGQHALLMHTSQTGVPAISRPVTSLRSVRLLLPPLLEQQAISSVLSALDDKIELNRRMSETLYDIAASIFEAMFLVPTHDSSGGSEVTESTIGEEVEVTMGQSPPGSTYNTEGRGLPFYQGRADFGFLFPSRRVYCTAPTRYAQAGDTLLSVRAPVGDTNVAIEDCAIGRGVAALRHKSGSSVFTYFLARSLHVALDQFNGEGTVFGSISKKALLGLACPKPSSAMLHTFEEVGAPILQRIRLAVQESHSLASLRDALLPKLISGELRVPEAEQLVSEVA